MMSTLFYFQPTLNRLSNNCIKLCLDKLLMNKLVEVKKFKNEVNINEIFKLMNNFLIKTL